MVRNWQWASAEFLSVLAFVLNDTPVLNTLHPCGGGGNCVQALDDVAWKINVRGVWDTNEHLKGMFFSIRRQMTDVTTITSTVNDETTF